jgi:hypothetical protein
MNKGVYVREIYTLHGSLVQTFAFYILLLCTHILTKSIPLCVITISIKQYSLA